MPHKKISLKQLAAYLGLNFCLSLALGSAYVFFTGTHPLELAFVITALVSNLKFPRISNNL